MADLDVQPKRSNSWWIWLLLVVIVAAILFFVLGKRDGNTGSTTTDSTMTAIDPAKDDHAAKVLIALNN